MKKTLLLVLLLVSQHLFAQTGRQISGIVKDSTGATVIGASVKLVSTKDTLGTVTDINGNYSFRNVKASQFLLTISAIGYQSYVKRYLYKDDASPLKLDPISLRTESRLLNTVEVTGAKGGPVVKQDTVEYRASDYPVRENSVAEDIIKRLPGVEVDKDGNVTAQGKSITRVRVNGKDYFEGDLKTATQNLPAEIIEKIQIVDDYGDQAKYTGIREGEADKIINIQIRPDRNKGMILNGNAGLGNKDRYQVLGNGQFLNNNRQISTIFNFNNTNASLFNFLGSGSRGFGGGGSRSGNYGGGGGFSGGGGGGFNSNGITNTQGGGLNYRDQWSKKVSVFGSYRFTHRVTNTISNGNTIDNLTDSLKNPYIVNTDFDSRTKSTVLYNNVNFNLEYNIDSLNYLRLSPSASWAKNKVDGTSFDIQTTGATLLSDKASRSLNDASAPFVGGNLIYNHRFQKPGRNFSVAGSVAHSYNDTYQEARDTIRNNNKISDRNVDIDNESINTNINATYSEPVGKYARLDFGYNFTRSAYDNNRNTDLLNSTTGVYDPSDSLSNAFKYSFTTQRYSLTYRFDKQRLYNFNIGITAQPTRLEGHSKTPGINADTVRKGFNIFPTARFSYFFAKTRSLNINYSGRSTEPSFSQIQPGTDLSNVQRPVVGNPDLKAAFTQTVNISFNNNDPATGLFINVGVDGNIISNRITRNVITYPSNIGNIQETRYLNADGYYSTSAFYSVGKPFFDKKYRLSLNGNVNYSNDIDYVNSLKNTGKNLTFSQGLRLQITPNRNVEIFPGVRYNRSQLKNSLNTSTATANTSASTFNFDISGKVYLLKTFVLGFDATKTTNSGYGAASTNPFIINTYLEKQFSSRRGAFRIQGFDVMKEASNVSRTQSGYSVTNTVSNRLTRYVMATISYRFSKFPGGSSNNNNNNNNNGFPRNRDGGSDGPGRGGFPGGSGGGGGFPGGGG